MKIKAYEVAINKAPTDYSVKYVYFRNLQEAENFKKKADQDLRYNVLSLKETEIDNNRTTENPLYEAHSFFSGVQDFFLMKGQTYDDFLEIDK